MRQTSKAEGSTERVSSRAGGSDALRTKAGAALAKGDAQWAAELSDHFIALDPEDADALVLKADALTQLAINLLTATGRN
ncbi:MAG: alkyl sulfatase dimerization domain-containing protein [Pseudomonadota bacterium]|jgi:alkyl sulfatase BDS1-like metallo-beta-lactamase superfamily hydrolase